MEEIHREPASIIDKNKELFIGAVRLFIYALFIRFVLLSLYSVPLFANYIAFFSKILAVPILGTVLKILILTFYTQPLDAFIEWGLYLVLAYFALIVVGGVVFPVRGFSERFKAISYFFGIHDLKLPHPVIRAINGAFEIRGCDPGRAIGPGVIICDSVTALALGKEEVFTRVIGPGLSFLEIGERAETAIDLRPQSMRRKVTTLTRDGIEIEMDLSVSMEIRRGEEWSSDMARYPFDKAGVFQAIFAERAKNSSLEVAAPSPRSAADWCESISIIAEDTLRQIVAGYTLDQIFAIDNPEKNPRRELADLVSRSITDDIMRYGGVLRSVSIGNIRPPHVVVEQRIKNWAADWEKRRRTVEALGEAQRRQLEESARALAQGDMLQSLSDAIAVPSEQVSSELLSLRLIQALELMAREPATLGQLEPNLVEILKSLVDLLRNPPTTSKPGAI